MAFIGIDAVLALLLAVVVLLAKARHKKAVRLIYQTSVTTIADLLQTFTAHSDPPTRIYAAVQGSVVARETTRLTAPLTGSSCVAYKVGIFWDPGVEDPEYYIKDSKGVQWAVDDGTGLALAPFNPFERLKSLPFYWPGREIVGDTFKNTPQYLDRVISHYGYQCLPKERWHPPHQDLSWEVSILKEFGNDVFLLGSYTVQEGSVHFELGSDSLLWFGNGADALNDERESVRSSARWVLIWLIVSFILTVVYLY